MTPYDVIAFEAAYFLTAPATAVKEENYFLRLMKNQNKLNCKIYSQIFFLKMLGVAIPTLSQRAPSAFQF